MSEQTPFPEVLCGAQLIDTQRTPSRPGELPELAVVLGRETNRPEQYGYVVMTAAVRNGVWDGFELAHSMDQERAYDEFKRRLRSRI